MNMQSMVPSIEQEWDLEEGFLGKLRMGSFDADRFERLIKTLEAVEVEETETVLDRRFVGLTWYIPQFMTWQQQRIEAQGGDAGDLELAKSKIEGILEKLLGVP